MERSIECAAHGRPPAQQKAAPAAPFLPLGLVKSGEAARVRAVCGKDSAQRFLRNLGFVEGAEVTVISELNGNVIVSVKGTRVAISKAMANRVLTD